ncbi:Hsp33 family molecular chaperone [Lichenihabitans sp. PAMC28606]|uniref:Hsp33 family molecular chaperone n=1 Tax=Lichenihabitans sp. PAMC28606 TaxID=2880932 RepID=UPI001D09AEE5|nr:Hsp33 family molecular chaperone [Lichenihabitans sp. PAMC28606]UDL96418.1 Hsp33 family molecular chaperone [Lichenihabitans sp. PAMC28606]
MTMAPAETRPVSDSGRDDIALPFTVTPLDVRGRVVRLGPSVDQILRKHGYPEPVARLVGEATALTALLGTSLKFDGRFQLQTRTDGIVDMLVVDFDAPDRLRAFARFDADRLTEADGRLSSAELLGQGHLALTIEQGGEQSRYQGIVPLEGQGLEAAADQYFKQSEQIPTVVRLAVAQSVTGEGTAWRAGGFLVQFLPQSEDRRRQSDLPPGDAPGGSVPEPLADDDAWAEAKALSGTIEDHELVDPLLSSERLLYRLFHERGVTVFDPHDLRDSCRCSNDRIAAMLKSFTPTERHDMVGASGLIGVTCEFCGTHRDFEPSEFDPSPPKT